MLGKIQDVIDRVKDVFADKIARYALIAVVIVVLALFMVGKSYGAVVMVLENGGDRIVLETTECKSGVKAMFKPGLALMNVTYVIGRAKKTVVGCYAIVDTPQGPAAFMFFEDMDRYAILMNKFKPGDISAKKVGLTI